MPDSWKVLVISDTHDQLNRAAQVIEGLEPYIDAVYFLGDYLRNGEQLSRRFPRLAFLSVAGNCDYTDRNLFQEVAVLGHRLYLCHGHRHGVKQGYDTIRNFGRVGGYDAVLFGHTHEPYAEEADGLLLLNPGSIGFGTDYAVLKLKKDERPQYLFGSTKAPLEPIINFLQKK